MKPRDFVGKKAVIRESLAVVADLFNVSGTITKTRVENHGEARRFYGRTKEKCPDELRVWLQFDEPLVVDNQNLDGWKGIWLTDPERLLEISS